MHLKPDRRPFIGRLLSRIRLMVQTIPLGVLFLSTLLVTAGCSYDLSRYVASDVFAQTTILPFSLYLPLIFRSPSADDGWIQLQSTPQRTGYTDDSPLYPYTQKWVITFWPETISHNVQVVTDAQRAYVGTKAGVMHAVSLKDGQEIWSFEANGPILHTAAVTDGFVYFAAMDGAVYRLDAVSGSLSWRFEAGESFKERGGFSTAVLLAEDTIFAGNRRGLFFAVSADTGQELWRYNVGAPILNSAAYDKMPSESFGRVVFGAEDMHVYCLNSNNGELLWTSAKLSGKSMRDYHPVITGGKVMIRTFFSTVRAHAIASTISPELYDELNPLLQELQDIILTENPGVDLDYDTIQVSVADRAKQDEIALFFADHAIYREFYVLDERTGAESYVPSIVYGYANNGVIPPPVVDRDGNVYTTAHMVTAISASKGGEGPGKPLRMDISTGRVVEWLPRFRLYGTGADETTNFSVGGNVWVGMHHTEGNASGVLYLDSREWYGGLPVGTIYSYPFSGNVMSGGNSASISGRLILHNRLNHIVAIEGQ